VIGLDAFMGDAPAWLLTLAGGVLADRADRRRVIAGFQSIQMLCPLLLIVLLVTGHVATWIVIATSLIVGATDALSMPSYQSIVPSIVEHDQIASGIALSSTQFNLSRILGPAVAGVLIGSIGMIGCFAVNAASYVPFIAVALWILPRTRREHHADDPFDGRRPFAGTREILRDRELRYALATAATTGLLCSPVITFCPVLVRNVFHGDASRFSITVAGFGVGGLLGGIALLGMSASRDRRVIARLFAVMLGAVVCACAVTPWFWTLPPLVLLAGLTMTISNTSLNTFVQSTSPAHLRGRIVSLYMLSMRGGMALGSVLTGLSSDLLGIRTGLLIDGALAVVIQLAIASSRGRGGAG
jgi:predicted MFS family arabinose efflux permease